MATPPLNLTGADIIFTMFLDSKPVADSRAKVKKGTVKERKVNYDDKYSGQVEYDLDTRRVGWEMTLEVFLANNNIPKQLDALEDARTARQKIPVLSFSVENQNRDGSFEGFILTPCTHEYDVDYGDSDAKSMLKINIRAKFKQAI